jgi:hypothetical protein
MQATVDIHDSRASVAAAASTAAPTYATPVFDTDRREADARIAKIVRGNAGAQAGAPERIAGM